MVSMILNKGSVTVKTLSRPVVKVRLMMKKLRNRLKKKTGNLQSALANWAIAYGVSHSSLLALLTLLSTYSSLYFHKDPHTLLQTPSSCEVKTMSGGEYFYFGLAASTKGTLKVPGVKSQVCKH